MPSREVRRAMQKKKKPAPSGEQVERGIKKKNKPLIYILSVVLLAVIVVAFVGLPVASGTTGGDRLIFGYYGKRPIEFRYGNYFSRQTQILADQMQNREVSEDNYLGEIYQVWRGAFERTVVHEGVLAKVEDSGLLITEDLIDQRLLEYGPYTVNGEFSEERYLQTSRAERDSNRRLFRESLKEEQFMEDYFDNQHLSDAETKFIKQMTSPERSFRYVYYAFDEFPEDQVVEFGRENSKLFRRIKLSRITIASSETDAEQIHQQVVENPGLFSEMAQTHSIDFLSEKGGEMDWAMYYDLEPDFPSEEDLDDVFSLGVDEISGIIVTEGSAADPTDDTTTWTMYKVTSPAVLPDFEDPEIIETVRSYITRYEGGMIEDFLLVKADAFIADARGTDFMSAAADHDLQPDITDYFPINYGNSYFLKPIQSMTERNVLAGAAYNNDFFIAAFSLEKDEVSEPVILDRNIIVLQMVNEREPAEEELEQIDYYYPIIVRQFRDQNLREFFLESDKLEDNFNKAFNEIHQPDT